MHSHSSIHWGPGAPSTRQGMKHPWGISVEAGGAAAAGLRLLPLHLNRLMVPAKISADTLGSSCCVREIFFFRHSAFISTFLVSFLMFFA